MTDWRAFPEATAHIHHDRLDKPIALRPLRSDDGALVAEFYASLRERDVHYFYPHPLDAEHAHKLAAQADDDGHIALLATEDVDGAERMMGYAYIKRGGDEERWHFGICIRPDRQSIGLGTMLLGRIARIARRAGVTRICLTVHKDNQRALRLYTAHGFVITGERLYERQGVWQHMMEAALE